MTISWPLWIVWWPRTFTKHTLVARKSANHLPSTLPSLGRLRHHWKDLVRQEKRKIVFIHWLITLHVTDGSDKNFLGDSIGGELGGALAVAEASSACAAIASSPPSTVHDNPTVNFVLMTRKGNKPQFKNLAVPSDSELAQNLRNREEVLYFTRLVNWQGCDFDSFSRNYVGRKGGERTREKVDAGFQRTTGGRRVPGFVRRSKWNKIQFSIFFLKYIFDMSLELQHNIYVCRLIVQLFTTSIAIAEVVSSIPKVFQTPSSYLEEPGRIDEIIQHPPRAMFRIMIRFFDKWVKKKEGIQTSRNNPRVAEAMYDDT